MNDLLDLDRAATTPVCGRVLESMLPYFRERSGNPSSVHAAGMLARRGLEEARERVALATGANPSSVTFTSSATEAIHLGVLGWVAAHPGARVVTALCEHSATLEAVRAVERGGVRVVYLRPDAQGVVAPADAIAAAGEDAALVALLRVNNETGVITDVGGVGEAVRQRGGALLVDAVQAVGYEPATLEAYGADLLVLSAHKIEGPKGAGALVCAPGVQVEPQIRGGGQERGRRAGTPAVANLVGFGVATTLAADGWEARAAAVSALRDRLERCLSALPDVRVHGAGAVRGPKHLNVCFGGADGDALLINLDMEGVLASAGSACSAGSVSASHVLLAMDVPLEDARSSVRFSLGDHLSPERVDDAAGRIGRAVARARGVAAAG